jgi:hypothetical protein
VKPPPSERPRRRQPQRVPSPASRTSENGAGEDDVALSRAVDWLRAACHQGWRCPIAAALPSMICCHACATQAKPT